MDFALTAYYPAYSWRAGAQHRWVTLDWRTALSSRPERSPSDIRLAVGTFVRRGTWCCVVLGGEVAEVVRRDAEGLCELVGGLEERGLIALFV